MICVAVGWLVWVMVLVSDVGIRSVRDVFAVGWQLWGIVWAVGLLSWAGAVGWPLMMSGVGRWVLWVVGVGGVVVVGWVAWRYRRLGFA